MQEYLSIINEIIKQHQNIEEHLGHVGRSLSDAGALFNLEKLGTEWVPGKAGSLSEKIRDLVRAIDVLDDGLGTHFSYEEEYLPPILGELVMRALIMEHKYVRETLAEAKATVTGVNMEGLSRDEMFIKEADLRQTIDSLRQAIEDHRSREETVLDMLRRVLEEK